MAYEFIPVFVMAVLVSVSLTPWVIRLAWRIGAIDEPEERKIHSRRTPRLGGVAVWTGFVLTVAAALHLFPDLLGAAWQFPYRWSALWAALALVLCLGTWDDVRSLRAEYKLAVQVLIATLVYAGGLRIAHVGNPFQPGMIDLGIMAYPVTVLWVVGITNAFNLIDGLDGLASGVAIISSLTIFSVAALSGDAVTAAVTLAIAGSVLGFLPFNFNPARIFLGDSGSLFLGFILSVVSIHGSAKGSTAVSIIVPVLALGLPIMDTLLSMIRRLMKSFLGEPGVVGPVWRRLKCILLPDREHIHHRLIARGIPQRTAVMILYLVSCALGLCAFAVSARNIDISLVLALIGALTVAGVSKLGYREMAFIGGGMFLPLYNQPMMNRRSFHRCLDLLFMAASFVASQALAGDGIPGPSGLKGFAVALALNCLIQVCVFSLGGIYRGPFRLAALGDLLRAGRTVVIAVLASALVTQILLPGISSVRAGIVWILDFYFLASLTTGFRISFTVLNYLFRRRMTGGKQVLIYGANAMGLLTLQKILNHDSPAVEVVGFLDDDPELEGKVLNGYPIYGGHWKLDPVLRTRRVQEIIFSVEDIQPEVLRRIASIAKARAVALRFDAEWIGRRDRPEGRRRHSVLPARTRI